MISLSFTILPVFLLLVLGIVLSRYRFPSDSFWSGVDKLVYWVLFPSLLYTKTSEVDFSNPIVGSYATVFLSTIFIVCCCVLLVNYFFKSSPPTCTSMMQAGVRFNTFIALAVAEKLYGETGLLFATLGASILIPTINVLVVVYMVIKHGKEGVNLGSLIFKELFKNPLIISILLGVSVNLMGLSKVIPLYTITELLAQATLPLVLLAVGASLQFHEVKTAWKYIGFSTLIKMVIFPGVIIWLCLLLNVTGIMAAVAVIFGAVPTATSGYALARQLGGNAPLMAVLISFQTAISIFMLPFVMWIAQAIFLS
ncbi:AEC family transporter [Marinomonas sp. 15G1-11]|uniref:AEC family transporter n=1 Tax=Marinomonas phaeophyticola TaxID=3004091 RepID=A0ABT4JNV9_9GAMM|nr:AEC family transporter [Marinomonas sp. 15G1-11]MCZ2720066.1 AEC family transporter [Marinomonas sp. 15G1-11]